MLASFPIPVTDTFPLPQRVALSSAQIAYCRAGKGPPLLLIHGWGASSRYWGNTLDQLADIRTVYALDLPGFGDSPPGSGIASAERLAALVVEFADALGLERFDLNGHSFGAGVAAYIAAHWPSRVNRVILTCLSVPRSDLERCMFMQTHFQTELSALWWRPWLVLWRPWLALMQPYLAMAWGATPLPQALAARFLYQIPSDSRLLQAGLTDLTRMDLCTAVESAASLGDPALIEALADITAPTLLVSGKQDVIMPASGVEVAAEMVPGSRLTWIDQCGHVPMVERSAEYHWILHNFLT